jgi:hypothetical protein
MAEQHHPQCPWDKADPARVRSVCGCPEGWPKAIAPDLDAIRREAFMAGYDAAEPPDERWWVDRRSEAYAAWQAQRRGETP